ncbi:autotransporter beta-domain protein [Leptotrichia wadei]|uniref:Autotransporter beta-domain protein n=1 Tax=Leptotrichia wadei TaxID=157687 RepID=A0A510KB30_9FUSO|nr:autotransporter-associated N-terminal domain-containing protein [Leptotrichia wadei]BBM47063.1 autotransporter beta-domain protein [Leptotrichia wadei]
MSNNLRQIARDLRSFVKRCKDVHYSDSLLISFLITGLLTFAPKLHADVADVASEQQEVTAQAYDAITDLRQSFMRARKENEKSLKGAQSELVQLLRQGDQVIKSPWSSFQFGTGYMNNDWGTTYRGRGGKFLEYYKRDNDLTKYVFDPTKHLYGATNLNIPRNQEPDALTINPANVHEPYKPSDVIKLETISLINEPSYNLSITAPSRVTTYVAPTNNPSVTRTISGLSPNDKYVRSTSLGYHDPTIRTSDGQVRYADRDTANNSVTTFSLGAMTTISGVFDNGRNSSYYDYRSGSNTIGATTHTSRNSVRTTLGALLGLNGTKYRTHLFEPDEFYSAYSFTASSGSATGVDAHHTDLDNGGSFASSIATTYNQYWQNAYNYYMAQHTGATVAAATQYAEENTFLDNETLSDNQTTVKGIDNATTGHKVETKINRNYSMGDTARSASVLVDNAGVTVGPSTFNVGDDGGWWHSGLEIDLGASGTTTVNNTTFNVYNNSIGLAIDADDTKDQTVTFTGDPGFYLRGSNGIGINVQNGVDTNGKVEISGNHDMHIGEGYSGVNNVAYNVTNHVKELNISNGNNPVAGGLTNGTGLIHLEGSNSIAFSDRGYVESGTVDLKNVHSSNHNNILGYFASSSATTTNSGAHEPRVKGTNSAIGWFDGTFKIQGIIGADRNTLYPNEPATVNNNIAIYAVSGQRDNVARSYITNGTAPASKALTVEDLHVGFGSKSVNGTMIFADKGTMVDVKGLGDKIVDSAWEDMTNATINWGYQNPESSSSLGTTIAYATGVFSAREHNLDSTADSGLTGKVTSHIKINGSDVDMISRQGTAYNATNGGEIEVTGNKTTRAGGYQSVIAYATGKVGNITPADPIYSKYANIASKISIEGDIIAADNNILGKVNSVGGNTIGTPDPAKVSTNGFNNRANTYQNIGAYAKDGATITIKTANKATNTVEDAAAPTGSLIYGLAAYANGTGSKVTYDSTGKGILVVSGKDGAVYATNNGQVEFNGDIINQDNSLNTVVAKQGSNAIGLGADQERAGLNTGTSHYSSTNDHARVTPFYVNRTSSSDTSSILFNKDTKIDMYDGILFTGNRYTEAVTDYLGTAAARNTFSTTADLKKFDAAKYRGMTNMTIDIMSDRVDIGVINQASNKIKWDSNQHKTGGTFLNGIAEYAGMQSGHLYNTGDNNFKSTFINGEFEIDEDINLEDKIRTANVTPAVVTNDPFNGIKMESELVTINAGKNITGDVKYLAGQGLNMANSLYRWDDVLDLNSWRKTNEQESGYINKGTINVWGGTAKNNYLGSGEERITGINVAYGTINNKDTGTVTVDHGYGIVGTDGSILNNEGNITVTGKYTNNGAALSALRVANRYSVETKESGENYGIVGLSTNNVGYGNNKIDITNKAAAAVGIITVDGDSARGIYAKNVNNAAKTNVTVTYDNSSAASPDAIKVNATNNDKTSKGVGIAIDSYANSGTTAGGILKLKTQNTKITADILTSYNGIGIHAKASNILFDPDSTGITIETKNDGAGIWLTDDSNVGEETDKHLKSLNYLYKGDNDKKGFGMVFTSKDTTNATSASNYLDITFNNNGATVTLADEKANSATGTTKGIAGILVNTDNNDTVTNFGDIKEDTSKTHVRSYGAVVNKGRLVNYGNIELNDSLNEDASNVDKTDLKKVNVGILANDHSLAARTNTYIENHGDITVGSNSNKNVGGFGIYGYRIKTGAKEDGSVSTITINKNSYGIYSGDGDVNVQKGTKLLVGNDTVLGSTTTVRTTAPATDIIQGRKTDAAYGVYIGDNSLLSGANRNVEVSADMDIDRFSYGIVLQNNANAALPGSGAVTNVNIGDGIYTLDSKGKTASLTAITAPEIILGTNQNTGGKVLSTKPSIPADPKDPLEQGNAVYYYSADKNSNAKSYARVTMNGDYNIAYYTEGSVDNFGTIDLRSQNDLIAGNTDLGYGNIGIVSANPDKASTNYGTITTSLSDTQNKMYSAGMAAGRNVYAPTGEFSKTEAEGYIVNRGSIVVEKENGIGMFATGSRSKAINYGDIKLVGDGSIGMYLDRNAQGENYGTITGNANGLAGVIAINGGYIKNYGTIKIEGNNSEGILTSNLDVKTDNEDSGANQYGGTESSIKYVADSASKTTGVGTTITVPDAVPMTKITVDGIDTPIYNVETDAANSGDWANNIIVNSSIQTGGTRIIDLSAKNEWGNPVWENAYKNQLSEVTSIGMYLDTSGVRYTNPINGIQYLKNLKELNIYVGPEATLYTNSKAIEIGDRLDENGNVITSNMLKPFNDALAQAPSSATPNIKSASLTWEVKEVMKNGKISKLYMSKVPYHSFAYDNDKSLVNFTNNLDNIYEIARQESAEKVIFNKLNSLGNGEGHILAQAFDQMRGHIYGGVQQRIKSTSDILGGEISSLRSERNVSKDSNKFKAFGQRNEFKTDTAGMPDWYSNAGGFAFVHEDETVRLGQSSGWSAGVVNNYFTFKDLSKSYENQAMAKVGVFKSIPLDANGTFILSLGGDGFFGRNDMKRRFWVVDQQFRAKASYYSYGAGLNAGLEKSFVVNDGFSIVPNLGIRAEYGRFSSIHEKGDMALNVKSDDYVSVKPSVGIDFRYNQEVFKNSNLTASLGFAYENEIGKLYDVENEARIVGAWTDYFGIRGDKEDKRGNFKSDLKLGLDNGRFGFNVNTGYDSKGHNFRAGMGLKVLY